MNNSDNNKRKLSCLVESSPSSSNNPPISRSGLGYTKPSTIIPSSVTTISNYSNFVALTHIPDVTNIETNINAANNFLDIYINDISSQLYNGETKPPSINMSNVQRKIEQLKTITRNEINNAEIISDHLDKTYNYNNEIISQAISNKESIKWKNDVDYIKNDHVKISDKFLSQKNTEKATVDVKEIPVYKRVKVNDIVHARYSQDDYYYKAVVLSSIHNGYNIAKYEVKFIDYNTTETVSWRDIDLKDDHPYETEKEDEDEISNNENDESEDDLNNKAVLQDKYSREYNINQNNSKINMIDWNTDKPNKDEDFNVFVGIPYDGIISVLNNNLFNNNRSNNSNWKKIKQ